MTFFGGPPTSMLPCFAAGHRVVVSGAVAHEDVMYRRERGCLGVGGSGGAVYEEEKRKGVVRQALQTLCSG